MNYIITILLGTRCYLNTPQIKTGILPMLVNGVLCLTSYLNLLFNKVYLNIALLNFFPVQHNHLSVKLPMGYDLSKAFYCTSLQQTRIAKNNLKVSTKTSK